MCHAPAFDVFIHLYPGLTHWLTSDAPTALGLGEFERVCAWVDAFGADADFIAEMPSKCGFCATREMKLPSGLLTRRAADAPPMRTGGATQSPALRTKSKDRAESREIRDRGQIRHWLGDDGVIAFAEDAAGAGEFFQSLMEEGLRRRLQKAR